MSEPLVLNLRDVGREDLPRVGGKGANLGELLRAGLNVPPGFCLTTAAYQAFVDAAPGFLTALEALEDVPRDDLEAARRAARRIREVLTAADLTGAVSSAAVDAWQHLGADEAYAVRSSATAEDLPQASFAGQQETFLNVRGERRLLEAIRGCWASLFTDRAVVYRIRNGFDHRSVALSVVVQQMVEADVSGILFTADPATGNRRVMRVEASYGLGEALVSGRVTPDSYQIRRADGVVSDVQIGEKNMAIVSDPGGGVESRTVDDEARGHRVLDDADLALLLGIGETIEAHFGAPQDIEWARAGEHLHVLQSRPITTLYPLPEPQPRDGRVRAYVCFNHVQVMLDPISPLGQDVLRQLLPVARGGPAKALRLPSAGGRMYIDVSALLRSPLRHRFPAIVTVADEHIARALAVLADRPAFRRAPSAGEALTFFNFVRAVGLLMWRVVRVVTVVDPEAAVSEVNGLLAQVEETFRATLDGASSADARIRLVPEALAAVFPVLLRVAPAVGAGMLSHTLLRRMTPSADPRDFERLMRALPNNVTTEMDLAVADLADVARRHPAVAAALTADEGSPQLDDIRPVEGGEAFCLATERFLDRYGIRGASEIDLARPRWRDDPSALLQVIAGNLERGGGHRERFAGLVADADAAADRIVRAAGRGPGGHFRRRIVKRLVANVRNYTGLRESPKFLMIKILGLVRTDALGVGERLVHEGRLDAPEDVFFLSLSELVGASGNRRDFRGVTSSRRDAHIRFSKLAPPGVMTSEGERVVAPAHRDLDRHQLGGTGASAGTVEGVARVLFDPVTERLESGEVLVTPFTDPGWTPLFVNASGLVMEVGGMMTHGSVVAREYGIPAVVGVAGATERIHTGMRIRVDGDQGLVELLDDDPAADVAS